MDDAVLIKVFDKEIGGVVFEGKVSKDIAVYELVKLECFWEAGLSTIYNKATNKQLKSFKGLHNHTELIASYGEYKEFCGVLYDGADSVLKKSKTVPSFACKMMTVWRLSHEECEKVFQCSTLEELSINRCELRLIPNVVGTLKNLSKLRLYGLKNLQCLPQEMRQLCHLVEFHIEDCSVEHLDAMNGGMQHLAKVTLKDLPLLKSIGWDVGQMEQLSELRIEWCHGVDSLPKMLKESKKFKSLHLEGMSCLKLKAEDIGAFSKLSHLSIFHVHDGEWNASFIQSLSEMIKSSTSLRSLYLNVSSITDVLEAALRSNGSLVEGLLQSAACGEYIKRNKENHKKALQCVVHLLAIRRWRNALNGVPKEMVKMIAMMLWMMRCDVNAWVRQACDDCQRK